MTGALAYSSCEGLADKLAEVRKRPFHSVGDTGVLDKAGKVDKLKVVDVEGLGDSLSERGGRLRPPLVAPLEQLGLVWSPEHLLQVPPLQLRF